MKNKMVAEKIVRFNFSLSRLEWASGKLEALKIMANGLLDFHESAVTASFKNEARLGGKAEDNSIARELLEAITTIFDEVTTRNEETDKIFTVLVGNIKARFEHADVLSYNSIRGLAIYVEPQRSAKIVMTNFSYPYDLSNLTTKTVHIKRDAITLYY